MSVLRVTACLSSRSSERHSLSLSGRDQATYTGPRAANTGHD